MTDYIIWNPEHIQMTTAVKITGDIKTVEGLVAVEAEEDCSWSSDVSTDNIEGIVQAVLNETNADVQWVTLADYQKAKAEYAKEQEKYGVWS